MSENDISSCMQRKKNYAFEAFKGEISKSCKSHFYLIGPQTFMKTFWLLIKHLYFKLTQQLVMKCLKTLCSLAKTHTHSLTNANHFQQIPKPNSNSKCDSFVCWSLCYICCCCCCCSG